MAAKKTTKTAAAKPATTRKRNTRKATAEAAPEAKPKKMSALDAAATVLTGATGPMTTKGLIDEMAKRGLWSSPGGKTPHATLYAAILREIKTKGKEARFAKKSKGHFAATTSSPTAKVDPKPVNGTKGRKPRAAKSSQPAAEPTIPDGTPGPKSMSELFRL